MDNNSIVFLQGYRPYDISQETKRFLAVIVLMSEDDDVCLFSINHDFCKKLRRLNIELLNLTNRYHELTGFGFQSLAEAKQILAEHGYNVTIANCLV